MAESYEEISDKAYNFHVSGNYSEALKLYNMLLEQNPCDYNILNLYSQLNFSLGNYDIALNSFKTVFENTGIEEVRENIIKTLIKSGKYDEAVQTSLSSSVPETRKYRYIALAYYKSGNYSSSAEYYEKLAALKNADSTDLFNLSLCYDKLNNYDKAIKCVLPVFNAIPDDYDISIHLASLFSKIGDRENELNFLINACNIKTSVDLLLKIGILYKNLGNDEQAVECFNLVNNIEPDNEIALFYLALIFKKHDKNVSLKLFSELIEKYPDNISYIYYLYEIYAERFDSENALKCAQKCIERFPEKPDGYILAGDLYTEIFRYEKAEEYYNKAYKFAEEESYDVVHIDIQVAYLYSVKYRYDDALKLLNKHKDNPVAKNDIIRISLKNKDFQSVKEGFFDIHTEAFKDDEVSYKAKKMYNALKVSEKFGVTEDLFVKIHTDKKDDYNKYLGKLWHGEDIKDKSLLIYTGHGKGDLFFASRYFNDIKKFTDNITLEVDEGCYNIMKYNFPDFKVIKRGEIADLSEYDYTATELLSLYYVNADLKNIENKGAYLSVSDEKIKEKGQYDFMNTDKLKVGIFWQGNPSILRNRSIKLKYLKPLFDIPNIQIYSFQISAVDYESDELKKTLPLIDLAPYIKNFEDTAAFLKNIDILVTIDTSIANLAGATGVKTFMMLPEGSDWRWFDDTETTPWYKSIRIFKQKTSGDWDEVVSRVKNELSIQK